MTDPACHLLRLRLIWQIAPFADIARELWQCYLLVTNGRNHTESFCKICTGEHLYLDCELYRKCKLCSEIGHFTSNCPNKCECDIIPIHFITDHKCELCEKIGHRYKSCPARCPCGIFHHYSKHRCTICSTYGHLEKNCAFLNKNKAINKCQKYVTTSISPFVYAYRNYMCKICFTIGHTEKSCNEKCVCGDIHYLTEHECT